MIEPKITKLPKASILYLLFAGLVDLGIAFMPIWSLTPESGLLEHVTQSFKAVVQETANESREVIAIFWLPFVVGVSCLGAAFAALFVSNRPAGARAVLFAPLVVTAGVLGYYLVMRTDIHILAIALLPLAGAWWEYHKRGTKLKELGSE